MDSSEAKWRYEQMYGDATPARGTAAVAATPWIIRLAAPLLAFLIVGALVVTGSRAAFSDTTDNTGNTWAAGTVTITDDDAGAAMFSASDMRPGDTVVNCIVVTYTGSLTPADVSLYGTAGGSGLAAYLDLDVDLGSGGSFGDCSGFVADAGGDLFTGTLSGFAGAHTDFSSGLASWSPGSSPSSKTFRFTLTLQDDNGAQGLDADATFTWEAQNQ